jgi:hypothetical protein
MTQRLGSSRYKTSAAMVRERIEETRHGWLPGAAGCMLTDLPGYQAGSLLRLGDQ